MKGSLARFRRTSAPADSRMNAESRATCHVSAIIDRNDRTRLPENDEWYKENCSDLMEGPKQVQRSTTGLQPSPARQDRNPTATALQPADGLDSARHCHLHNATRVEWMDVRMGSVPMHHL